MVLGLLLSGNAYAASVNKADFCNGYKRGYGAGYQKATNLPYAKVPIYCPYKQGSNWYKKDSSSQSDFEHGYIIGYEDGLKKLY